MERHGRSSERALLLIIEDDTGVREGLMDLLAPRFDVLAASDADAGVELAREHRPDLVLLDRFLPSGDGLAVLETLQGDVRTEMVPVIFLTGDADEATLERCLEMGAVDFIHKPASSRELLARIDRAVRQSEQQRKLQVLAQTDALTGLANFRALSVRLEDEFKRALRYGYAMSVVVIDLDHLKAINDGMGHDVGNRAILALATLMQGNLRESDFAARFGGDEFVVLLPHQTSHEAAVFAERLRTELRGVNVQRGDGRPAPFGLSISVGVADHTADSPRESTEALLKAADAALYEAKREGRDRVVVYGQSVHSPAAQRH
ncbi:diguanylate cyclase [Corallococcus exiguus]|uniref:diguanylate cyclase n=1 Tax=Corallococcus exiguus TaxID=83462 RepID=A0A7Y1RZT0_9BACT|nr:MULTISPECIES: diguanylate cyclase [Corallococcus]NBC40381.1 diguanylate cyclase [Corallococcus exiguus]NNC15487.1 diguanylate cyclase [Corallococcus exiguus]NRD57506.1 diguanylate cyclase [Corallococcus exiguus]NRD64107.1 diguanylate cyclase [Corallococcus exiguus]RKH19617.1 diguanylate cyclase [Corallococcus sp. CA041A]